MDHHASHDLLNLFTRVREDQEKKQYLILAELRAIQEHFQNNRIYPHLSRIVHLRRTLLEIQRTFDGFQAGLPKRMSSIDWNNREIRHEAMFVEDGGLESMQDLIVWAIPHLDRTVHEGITIHDFVEANMKVEHVGVLPNYRSEGYFIIPDNHRGHLNVFVFLMSVYPSADETFRALKTRFLQGQKVKGAIPSLNALKLDLIRKEKELPNPATYFVDTDLDFSFHQTILPVAKRKLMRQILH